MDWSRRRQRLNHDWLKNQFLTALAHMVSIALEHVEDPAFIMHFFDGILPQWQSKRKEILELAASFEIQMSPRLLFQSEPLASNPGMQELWIANFMDALWRARIQPERRLSRLEGAVEDCDASWEAFRRGALPFRGQFDAGALEGMYRAFARLAHVLSEFPSNVNFL